MQLNIILLSFASAFSSTSAANFLVNKIWREKKTSMPYIIVQNGKGEINKGAKKQRIKTKTTNRNKCYRMNFGPKNRHELSKIMCLGQKLPLSNNYDGFNAFLLYMEHTRLICTHFRFLQCAAHIFVSYLFHEKVECIIQTQQ